ncbi:MAG: hypothetical protein ACXVHW_11070, partial [Methanobacterium sp.]
ETIKIIKTRYPNVNESQIKIYIKKYGNKPRFIFTDIQNDIMTSKSEESSLKVMKSVSKLR